MNTLVFGNEAFSLNNADLYSTIRWTPELAFDDLTRLAACVCQTPIALLGLIEKKGWYVKSQAGIDLETSQGYLALCTEILKQNRYGDGLVFGVSEAFVDQPFANDQKITTSPDVQFYAGIPLVTPQGQLLGILSVFDWVPRELTLQQQEALAALSRQAISLISGTANYTLCCASAQMPSELHNNFTRQEIIEENNKPVKQSQQQSGQNRTTLQAVLDQAYLVAVTDSRGKIKYVNDKFCTFYQYSASELEGINHRLLNSSYHSSDFFRQMWATISQGQIWRGEIRNRAKDGSFYWVDTTIVPILNEQGKPSEYVSLCKDISDRKQLTNEGVRLCDPEELAASNCPDEARFREQTRNLSVLDESNQDGASSLDELGDHTSACPDAYRFFTLSPDLLGVISLDGYFRHVNPAFEKTLLYSPEELLNRHFLDFVHPDDKTATRSELEKLASNSSILYVENRYRCQNGSYKWLAWKFSKPVEDGLVYAIARDTTKRKQTEAALLERSRLSTLEAEIGVVLVQTGLIESRLQQCAEAMVQHLDAIGAGIWTVDPVQVETPNSSPLNLQASAGQLLPADIFTDYIAPNQGLLGAIAQTRQPIDAQFSSMHQPEKTASKGHNQERQPYKIFFTGYPLIVESRLVGVIALFSHQSLSGDVYGALGWIANAIAVAIDRAWAWDEALKRREALLFWLASQIRHSLDIDTILATAVTEIRSLMQVDCCHFLWCSLEPHQPSLSVTHEARDSDLPSLLSEESLPQLAPLEQAIRNLQPLRIDDVARDSHIDLKTRSLFTNWGITSGLLLPLKTQTGQLGGIFCSHYHNPRAWNQDDVELLQAVVNQIAIAIEHAELFASTRAAALAAQTQASQLEVTLQELQHTEALLIQTEKMSSLGQMVAGIAHEINNPVNFITGNLLHATNYIQDLINLIQRYQQHYPTPALEIQKQIHEIELDFLVEDLPKLLASLKIGADRIHEIVLSLRNFSRCDKGEMQAVNLHEGLDSTLLILNNRLKACGNNPGIKVIKDYEELPLVTCYPGQLNQVFMNIISNAIDALENQPEPRIITIHTSLRTKEINKAGEDKEARRQEKSETGRQGDSLLLDTSSSELPVSETSHPSLPTSSSSPQFVIIQIADNGLGMTQDVVERLFEPFFTTKPVGKGTGLGLAISYQIVVEKHSGILKCFSEPGQGTEFLIQIPLVPSVVSDSPSLSDSLPLPNHPSPITHHH